MVKKIKAVGSREEVYLGQAKHTSGGLKKADLLKVDTKGKVVYKSKAKIQSAKARNPCA